MQWHFLKKDKTKVHFTLNYQIIDTDSIYEKKTIYPTVPNSRVYTLIDFGKNAWEFAKFCAKSNLFL